MSPEGFLLRHILDTGKRRGWTIVISPPEMERVAFRHPDESEPSEVDVPAETLDLRPCSSAFVDIYCVYVGSLGVSVDEAEDCLYSHHRRAAWARSWLTAKENLYLFLTGPLGSGTPERTRSYTQWKDVAHAFERDERICRKMVWLPTDDTSKWDQEVRDFCDRTVLAEPWKTNDTVGELDPIGKVLSEGVPLPWRRILESPPTSEQELLDQLLKELDP